MNFIRHVIKQFVERKQDDVKDVLHIKWPEKILIVVNEQIKLFN